MAGIRTSAKWIEILENEEEVDLNGFRVEALDGGAGRIEQMLFWSNASMPDYVVVDTGRWFFGHKSVLPIQFIEEVDLENRCLRIPMSKKQIRDASQVLPIF